MSYCFNIYIHKLPPAKRITPFYRLFAFGVLVLVSLAVGGAQPGRESGGVCRCPRGNDKAHAEAHRQDTIPHIGQTKFRIFRVFRVFRGCKNGNVSVIDTQSSGELQSRASRIVALEWTVDNGHLWTLMDVNRR
jgi:hypothetical protein